MIEGDLLLGGVTSVIATLVERTSRFTLLVRLPDDKASEAVQSLRAADAAGLVYMRSAGLPTLRAVFLPVFVPDGRAVIAISASASRRDILQWLTIALGHHFLGHRSFDAYLYGAEGPLFDDGTSATDAFLFARCFFLGAEDLQTAPDQAAGR